MGAELRCQRVWKANLAPVVLRLRRLDPAPDQGAADTDLGLALSLEVEGDRLADPQAGRRQELEGEPVALWG